VNWHISNQKLESLDFEDRKLAKEIVAYVHFFQQRRLINSNEDFSRYYLTFYVNLKRIGLEEEAEFMLGFITPNYYKKSLQNHMLKALKAQKKFERIKHRTDKDSLQLKNKLRIDSEYLTVGLEAIKFLQTKDYFPGMSFFREFTETFDPTDYHYSVRPVLTLIPCNENSQARH